MPRGFSRSGSSGGGRVSFGGGGSGGFRFGGGSSHRSSGGGGGHRPRGPMRIPMFGRVIVIGGWLQSLFSFMIFALVALGIVFFNAVGNVGEYKDYAAECTQIVQDIETYDVKYKEMIANKDNPGGGYYKVDAVFENRLITYYDDEPEKDGKTGVYKAFMYEGKQYYFIIYKFSLCEECGGSVEATDSVCSYCNEMLTTSNTKTIYQSTYVQWTKDTFADEWGTMGTAYGTTEKTIEIVYKLYGTEVWSINTDYTLEGNIDYLDYKAEAEWAKGVSKNSLTTSLICGGIFAVIIVVIILILVNKYKKAKKEQAVQDAKDQAEIAEAMAKAEEAQRVAKSKGRVCKYCGIDVPDGDDTCPGCGSRDFE